MNLDFKGMRMLLRGLLFVFGLSVVSLSLANPVVGKAHDNKWPTYPTINYGTDKKADLIKEGETLAKAGDCIACHTDTNGIPFAGGLPIATPFGTIYTPNITPDKETGIGGWTSQQFIKAMHEGISPQGNYYYPAFPYLYFNKITTNDLIAIKAYLDALPPVKQKNKSNKMLFPFNWRFLQFGWRLLFFDSNNGPYKYNPVETKEWNRGAYLVNGLGHCSMCHTPMYYFIKKEWVLGAPKNKYFLSGATVQDYFAPNITSAIFKNTPTQDITNVFLKDELVGGGTLTGGPMDDVNHDSLRYLSKQDLEAIATYLKTVVSQSQPAPKSATSISAAAGEPIYQQYCASCHATGAGGAPKFNNKTDWAPRIQQGLPTLYKNAIYGIGAMPPKGLCNSCTKVDVQSAVLYMVDSVEGKKITGAQAAVSQGPTAQQLTSIARGKMVYQQVCATCHDNGNLGAPKLLDQAAWTPIMKNNMDILIQRSIKGYKGHPPMGACYSIDGKTCTQADVIAAVKYMAQTANPEGNYSLW